MRDENIVFINNEIRKIMTRKNGAKTSITGWLTANITGDHSLSFCRKRQKVIF